MSALAARRAAEDAYRASIQSTPLTSASSSPPQNAAPDPSPAHPSAPPPASASAEAGPSKQPPGSSSVPSKRQRFTSDNTSQRLAMRKQRRFSPSAPVNEIASGEDSSDEDAPPLTSCAQPGQAVPRLKLEFPNGKRSVVAYIFAQKLTLAALKAFGVAPSNQSRVSISRSCLRKNSRR